MAKKPATRTPTAPRRGTPEPARTPRVLPIVGALVVVAALVAAAIALTSGGGTKDAGLVVKVAPKAAYALMQQNAGHAEFQVIDVRTPAEFAGGHLPGATNIDVNGGDFAAQIGKLPKTNTFLVYCHSGNRSAVATAAMEDKGFTRVYDLAGGITAWAQAGYSVSS